LKIFILFTFLSFFFSRDIQAQQREITPAAVGVQYGKKIDKSNAITVDKLENSLKISSKYKGKLTGRIVQVCPKSGCFLTLQRDGNKEPIMVRFTDYSYFVPADLAGKNVILEGYAKLKEISNEITFIADGILVVE